jgi:hypothetical protein
VLPPRKYEKVFVFSDVVGDLQIGLRIPEEMGLDEERGEEEMRSKTSLC